MTLLLGLFFFFPIGLCLGVLGTVAVFWPEIRNRPAHDPQDGEPDDDRPC